MIIKKPYAFLIKHFRIIHLILSVCILYLVTKTHSIFTFFNDYVKNGYYTFTNNLQTSYINLYMFLSIIFIITLSAFIYLLMRWKKKSRILYISICLFYFSLFIGLLIYFNVFNTILNTTFDIRTVRAYRDIITILYIPQYLFLGFSVIRAIGFDIKKFDFGKDLKELDIKDEDREEIEVTFGQDNYKLKRSFRRIFSEIKYYAIENKFFFAVICGTILLVISFIFYRSLSVVNKRYKETEFFNVNGIVFKVNNSFITDTDYRGNTILENKKYIVVSLTMENTNPGRTSITTDSFRLFIGDNFYNPIFSKNEYFKDLGEGYGKNTILQPAEEHVYIMVFEIPKEEETSKVLFRMIDNVSLFKGELSAKYKEVSLNLQNYFDNETTKEFNIKDGISLEESTLNKSEIVINSYDINDLFTENYQYCISEKCYDGTKQIKAEALGKDIRTILKLNLDLELDNSLYINRFITNNTNFVSMFGEILYTINGEKKTYKMNVKNLDIETKNVYLEVPNEIKNATEIKLKLTIRNKEYIIKLR